jgi:15-cis-phytoene synthase
MNPGMNKGAIAALVRRHDPDRFLTALFAPPEKRDALLTLYAFNYELARAREAVSEPPLALIRLQWWREVVEGARRRHEVAEPLTAAIEAGELSRADLLALIDAREIEAEPAIDTLAAWRAYLLANAGGLAVAAARLLGAPDPEALRRLGAAYGVAGLLRSIPAHARQGRCMLPGDVLAEHGLTREQVIAHPIAAPIEPVILRLASLGLALLDRPIRLPRRAVAAVLPAVLARRDLKQAPAFAAYRGLGDRMAVMLAGLRGRV